MIANEKKDMRNTGKKNPGNKNMIVMGRKVDLRGGIYSRPDLFSISFNAPNGSLFDISVTSVNLSEKDEETLDFLNLNGQGVLAQVFFFSPASPKYTYIFRCTEC